MPSSSSVSCGNSPEVLAETLEQTLQNMCILIDELNSKQEGLLGKIEVQNSYISDNTEVKSVHKTMLRTHQYYKKLVQVKKDMMDIHSKSSKLKERALKLQRNQEVEALNRQKRQLADLQREQDLIAKPVAELSKK